MIWSERSRCPLTCTWGLFWYLHAIFIASSELSEVVDCEVLVVDVSVVG